MSVSARALLLALSGMALMPIASAAQTSAPVTFGVKAGVNSANVKDPSNTDYKRLWGAVGGIFMGHNINDNIGWQLEALVSQKGAKDNSEIIPEKVKLTYLDLPLLLRFGNTATNKTHFHAFTGPQLSFKLKSELVPDTGPVFDLNDEVKNTDFGWTFGAGVEESRFSLDARYTLGLANINKLSASQKVKNRTFTILAGVRLK